MSLQLTHIRRGLLAVVIATTLAACNTAPAPIASGPSPAATPNAIAPAASAAPSAAASPSASPSASPAASASEQPAASAAPSASPATGTAEHVLPAPLLFLRQGQIARMERDGKTITTLTSDQPGQPDILAVIDFDVSPVDGALVYVVQGSTGNTLVRADANGQNRTVLLSNAYVNMPRWSPDGTQIALQAFAPPENTPGPAAGVYLVPATGGALTLLQASQTPDPANPSADVRAYMPTAWSPDGRKLLLAAYSLTAEVCSAVVKDLATGALVPIQAPQGMVSGCAGGQWSVDGQTISIQMNRPGPQPPVPGLWQADPNTGAITPFIQGEGFENGSYQLVTNQRPLANGSIYAFLSVVEALPEPFSGERVEYKLFQGSQTDGQFLRDEQFPLTGQAIWANDTSGIVVDMLKGTMGDVITAWVPVDGGPVVELGPFMGEAKRWGM